MTITDAQRLAIAQFCGWEFRPCRGKAAGCDSSEHPCGWVELLNPNGLSLEWTDDGEFTRKPPPYDDDPALVGPMLLAMRKRGRSPCLAESRIGGQWVCSTDRYIGTGDTMNEACCRAILQIIESGAKPQGGER